MREIERARQFGFTEGEYTRMKADYLRALENVYNERSKMKSEQFVSQYVSNFINGDPIPSIEDEYALMTNCSQYTIGQRKPAAEIIGYRQ